jgi:3',5'-cyclic AMP phosphodiesterase CpdA
VLNKQKRVVVVVLLGILFWVSLLQRQPGPFAPSSSVPAWQQESFRLVYRTPPPRNDKDGTHEETYVFRILQIADLHLGEAEYTAWGPEQDRKTWRALDRLITAEQQSDDPLDLIVLSGDQLTANNVDANATVYYKELATRLSLYGIPFCMIFGNHDDMAFRDRHNVTHPARTSRTQLVEVLQDFPLSLTQSGPAQVFGVSNYWLDLWLNATTVGSRLLFLDSGGGALPQSISPSQLRWVTTTNQPPQLPVVAFSHIPTTDFTFASDACRGANFDGGISPLQTDAGLVETLVKVGNVHLLGVGHIHGNDYCCRTDSNTTTSSRLHLCFGKHSGYGGYGRWDRGARVYELAIQNEDPTTFSWTSYVRMESGEKRDSYTPL